MKKVRKAIIPVAGLGTRFLPETKSIPKEMMPIVDKPTLQLILEEVAASGIEEVLLITRGGKGAIENHFDSNFELETILERDGKLDKLELVKQPANLVKIFTMRQDKPLGSGHAIKLGKSFVGDEPFAVLYGDDLMYSDYKPALSQLIDIYEKTGANVIGCKEVPEELVYKYGIIKYEDEETGKIETIIEKPKLGEHPSTTAGLGRYVVNASIFDCLETLGRGAGNEYQFTDAMKALMDTEDFYACLINGTYYDTGNQLGYVKANIEYALRRDDIKDELKEYIKGIK